MRRFSSKRKFCITFCSRLLPVFKSCHVVLWIFVFFFRFTYVAPSVLEEMQSVDFRPRLASPAHSRNSHNHLPETLFLPSNPDSISLHATSNHNTVTLMGTNCMISPFSSSSIFDSSYRSMSRRMPRRPHPSGGGTPLPPTVSEAMELTAPITGSGAEAMDTVWRKKFRPQLPMPTLLKSIDAYC